MTGRRLTLTLQADEASPEGQVLTHLRAGALHEPRRSAWVALGAFWAAIAAHKRGDDPEKVARLALESIEELRVQMYRIASVCGLRVEDPPPLVLLQSAETRRTGDENVRTLLGANAEALGKIDFDD